MVAPPASKPPLSGQTPLASVSSLDLALIGVAGAWLNSVAYGFHFDAGNQWFQLAQIRWLQNPSLYPGDPIRQAFASYPTAFTAIVAWLGRWAAIEHVLLVFFVLTKLLFFLALARLVGRQVRQRWLTLAIAAAVALSPVLNDLTPLAHSDLLDSIQTHTPLAIALLLWAGVLLIEERWVAAAAIAAAAGYLDGMFVASRLARGPTVGQGTHSGRFPVSRANLSRGIPRLFREDQLGRMGGRRGVLLRPCLRRPI